MHLVSLPPVLRFTVTHPKSKQALLAWTAEVKKANWTQPADIQARFTTVTILKNRRVVFNIKGNDYRLVAAVAYKAGFVFVKFIGTHLEYDAIDVNTVEQF